MPAWSDVLTPEQFRNQVNLGLTEAQFQKALVDTAEELGWMIQHTKKVTAVHKGKWRSYTPVINKGFPDLILARPGDAPLIVVAELKTERGTPTKEQKDWLGVFAKTGMFTYLWKPRHWDAILDLLAYGEIPDGKGSGAWDYYKGRAK